jgi:hypothetical protein
MRKSTSGILSIGISALIFFFSAGCGGDSSSDKELPLNSKVIMIGDSYFAKNEYIPDALENLAGERYRHYYVSGALLGTDITNQYEEAKTDDSDIRTVIMVGGGNEILNDNTNRCWGAVSDPDDCTALIDSVIASGQTLINTMHTDGVENVVYMFYPNLIAPYSDYNDALNFAYTELWNIPNPGLTKLCRINTRPDFAGHPEYFITGDFHPSKAGGKVIAQHIWDEMQANGIEQ